MPIIHLQTKIDAERSIVFDLSRSIDLHKISTQQTHEQAISGRTKGLIELGEEVTWRAKHFGVYQNLTAKITQFDQPNSFTDEMVKGAFVRLIHEHLFESVEGKTLMIDCFEYTSPLGIIGRWADGLFLKTYMTRLLVKRNQTIKEYAESNQWKSLLP